MTWANFIDTLIIGLVLILYFEVKSINIMLNPMITEILRQLKELQDANKQ